ncbi:monodehydroascorbate reductase 4, peroxisomal-like [Bidens hawaiensis]|uniref:monodehydroascorbate reductase 4, peroxisomal-like n=1 Tax=Bidens hawaiensis TaxID=980011 RepID=UPI004049EC0D
MGRDFAYVILGGGVAAGYAALEFTKKGVSHGELCIVSDEPVAPYERPALSKGFLFPEAPARLPGFHTCVGANEERLTPNWYTEHGIDLILGTRVTSVNIKLKTLLTATGETITYKFLIIATGARALKLEDIGINGSNAENLCYLRDLADATKLMNTMRMCMGGSAIVVGGGYIGMECAASLVMNKINVSMVFPGPHCMGRLFTPQIARYYEDFYSSKGVNFIKGTSLSSLVFDSKGKVTGANLKDGRYLHADMVVVGIGGRPNTGLFENQLTFENGGIKVNNRMQTSNSSVCAVGDIASFPIKLYNDTRRVEHVDAARKTAKQAVCTIMEPRTVPDFDYLPFFYSRAFSLSWRFYGDNVGEVVHFGDFSEGEFGAYWVNDNRLVGCFLEGGKDEEYVAIEKVIRVKPVVLDLGELERAGLGFVMAVSQKQPVSSTTVSGCGLKKPVYMWYAASGIVVAASVAAFSYWYAAM